MLDVWKPQDAQLENGRVFGSRGCCTDTAHPHTRARALTPRLLPAGHEGVVHTLPVLGRSLLLPERPLQPQLQCGHEPSDTQPQYQPYAGKLDTHAVHTEC